MDAIWQRLQVQRVAARNSIRPWSNPIRHSPWRAAAYCAGAGEGEFAGGLDATSIFLDGTPLGNADGSMNFENVSWDFRPGTDPDADPGLSCGRKRNQYWRIADEGNSVDAR
jgi:hypothetical protein